MILELVGASEFVQRLDTLFVPLLPGYPEVLARFHDISEDSPTQEDHMFPTGRVLDLDLEFL